MKERMQKMPTQSGSCPQQSRPEAKGVVGVQKRTPQIQWSFLKKDFAHSGVGQNQKKRNRIQFKEPFGVQKLSLTTMVI
jgi:hypothetical protein